MQVAKKRKKGFLERVLSSLLASFLILNLLLYQFALIFYSPKVAFAGDISDKDVLILEQKKEEEEKTNEENDESKKEEETIENEKEDELKEEVLDTKEEDELKEEALETKEEDEQGSVFEEDLEVLDEDEESLFLEEKNEKDEALLSLDVDESLLQEEGDSFADNKDGEEGDDEDFEDENELILEINTSESEGLDDLNLIEGEGVVSDDQSRLIDGADLDIDSSNQLVLEENVFVESFTGENDLIDSVLLEDEVVSEDLLVEVDNNNSKEGIEDENLIVEKVEVFVEDEKEIDEDGNEEFGTLNDDETLNDDGLESSFLNNEDIPDKRGETGGENKDDAISDIKTGDVSVMANISNVLNTNLFGEDWDNMVLNIDGFYNEDVNILEILLSGGNFIFQSVENVLENSFEFGEEKELEFEEEEILNEDENKDISSVSDVEINNLNSENDSIDDSFEKTIIENKNDLNLTNEVSSEGESGGNLVDSEGDVLVETGDVSVVANIVNIANTNIVGDSWVFAVINVFGSWLGDLIVPGNYLLKSSNTEKYSNLEIKNDNEVVVDTEVEMHSETGNNQIEGKNIELSTGDANSSVTVVSDLNTNIVGDNWFSLEVNDFSQKDDKNNSGELSFLSSFFSYDFETNKEVSLADELVISNSNNASVKNDIGLSASSGGNVLNGEDVNLKTGNADTEANIFNLINTNIVGSNWFYGIVNVFGDWSGDVDFAYPDIVLSSSVSGDDYYQGDEIEYNIDFKNEGSAKAKGVYLRVDIPDALKYKGSDSKYFVNKKNDYVIISVGDLEVGDSGDFKIVFEDVFSEESEEVNLSSYAKISNKEDNEGNNVSYAKFKIKVLVVEQLQEVSYDYEYDYDSDASLKVKRVDVFDGNLRGGDVLTNSILVENDSDDPVFDAVLKEELKTNSGIELVDFVWQLGDLAAGDAFRIDYQVFINPFLLPGTYHFQTYAKGQDYEKDKVKSSKKEMAVVVLKSEMPNNYSDLSGDEGFSLVSSVQAAPIEPRVLGESLIANSCVVLPLWVWVGVLSAQALAVNWAVFPGGVNILEKRRKRFWVALLASFGAIWFWWTFHCGLTIWFLVLVILIFFVQYMGIRETGNNLVNNKGY